MKEPKIVLVTVFVCAQLTHENRYINSARLETQVNRLDSRILDWMFWFQHSILDAHSTNSTDRMLISESIMMMMMMRLVVVVNLARRFNHPIFPRRSSNCRVSFMFHECEENWLWLWSECKLRNNQRDKTNPYDQYRSAVLFYLTISRSGTKLKGFR